MKTLQFLKIMESRTRENEKENWMLLPFRNLDIKMSNNRHQAENYLEGLLETFKGNYVKLI